MMIIGCGYIGQKVAQQLQQQGESVTGVIRSDTAKAALNRINIGVIQCDLDQISLPENSTHKESIFYFVPPSASGVEDSRMGNFISSLDHSGIPKRITYISTSGVYGNCKGEWADETRKVNPQVDRAKRRWDAERQLQSLAEKKGVEIIILRVAGIYGRNKLPLDRIKAGVPMIAEKEAPWTNRIHADDLVTSCLAAMSLGKQGGIYNICDGAPSNMADYFNQVADKAGLKRPPIISLADADAKLSAGILSYLAESRRLDNNKLINELMVELKYPNLEAGLVDCFKKASKN